MNSTDLAVLRASLQHDAELMHEFRDTEMWKCVMHQLAKMEAQAVDRLLGQTETMDQINYWRGRLAAVRDLRTLPDMIIGWAEQMPT